MVDIEDDFIFDRELGKGNYAVVKLAISQEDGQQYAVKIISQDVLIESSRATEAIVNEVSILRKLDHPRIVKLVRLYESTENLYLVLEYVSGGELFKRILARKSFSEESASLFMKNLLETLSYIHSKNIVHRDIKPENILMVSSEEDNDFKIADFGLATESSYSMTLRCGSPGYVAPEILRKTAYNTKVDVFSAGVIMYILLSGRTPFYGKSPNEILARNKECRFYFNEKYWGKISRQGIDLVLKLTSTDPNQRPNAEEALKHPWFYKIHDKTVPLNFAVSPSSKIPLASPGEAHISHNFMERVNRLRVPASNTYFASLFGAQKEEKEEEAKVHLGIRRISPVRRDLAQKLFSGLREFDPSIKVVAKPTPKETPPKLDTFSSLEISDSAKIESPSSAIKQEDQDTIDSKN
jgi:serine/threonine protein kinase